MDLNVSLDASRKNEAAAMAAAAMAGMSNGSEAQAQHQHQHQQQQQQQQQRKRKANRDSWPFMHAIMLLECFKEVWTKSNMGNLTMAQWTEVSNRVNSSCGINMNEQQCRTKVDNLKKRYKRERMKYAPTGHTSPWEFYSVMNKLFGNTTKLSAAAASPGSGQPSTGENVAEDSEGSEEDDVVVLDNGGDLIFGNIVGLPGSPQATSFGKAGHHLLLEGTESQLDASSNSKVGVDASSLQDAFGFANAGGSSPSSSLLRKAGRTSKRRRDSVGTTVAADGTGDLLKEVEKERNGNWQRKWLELAKADKKGPKSSVRPDEPARIGHGRDGPGRSIDEGSHLAEQFETDELDDHVEPERRKDEVRARSVNEVEQKLELAAKALINAQDEKERLEGELRVARELLEHRKSLAKGLKFSFKKSFLEKLIPADAINHSLSKFPYYLSDVTRDFLVEALDSCINQPRRQLPGSCSSSHMILLNGPRNSAIYQDTLVKALAHDRGLGVLVLDSVDLAPQDYGDHEDSDGFEFDREMKNVSILRKGDRVLCRVNKARDERSSRRGRVVAVSQHAPGKVGVVLDSHLSITEDGQKLANKIEELRRGDILVEWHYASDLEKDQSSYAAFTGEWHAALGALSEIAKTRKPFIIYLPEVDQWYQRAVPPAWRHEFLDQVQKQFDKLLGNVAVVASLTSNNDEPLSGICAWRKQKLQNIYALFPNVVDIFPPKDDAEFWRWKMQLLQDTERVTCNRNIQLVQKTLMFHNAVSADLLNLQIGDFNLSNSEAESLVAWAINYELANSPNLQPDSALKFSISAGSLDRALLKLRRLKHSQGFKVAKDDCEEVVLSSIVSLDGGPKFEDVAALEDIKKILGETISLPLLRPELFTKGVLACPCKGVLLYGPPGTGKTLLARALATESSASFIWVRGSAIDYKWLEDPKEMTRTLFSAARRLAPTIIFLDEIDSFFGIQGSEAMTRLKLEFLSGWDKFFSRAGDQVVVMAATYRPFDLDEAVIQKFQRRLCLGLPDASSREKILQLLLAKEDVQPNFSYKAVAGLTDGYSGSDLKNLTIAAAYRPVREMLELEKSKANSFGQEALSQELRPLTTQDFVGAMEEVVVTYNAAYLEQLRQWDEQYGIRRW